MILPSFQTFKLIHIPSYRQSQLFGKTQSLFLLIKSQSKCLEISCNYMGLFCHQKKFYSQKNSNYIQVGKSTNSNPMKNKSMNKCLMWKALWTFREYLSSTHLIKIEGTDISSKNLKSKTRFSFELLSMSTISMNQIIV